MIADEAEFNRRYRTLVFDIGVTFGLWALVAVGIYLGNEAERAYLDRLSVVGGNELAAIEKADAQTRNKDDRYVVAAAPAESHVAALPIARPIEVRDFAAQPRPQPHSEEAASPRNEPIELAGAERFDRCTPLCESRDPMIAPAAAAQEVYRTGAMIGSASQASSSEHIVLHVGRSVVDRIVDLPRATFDTGSEALQSLMQMAQ